MNCPNCKKEKGNLACGCSHCSKLACSWPCLAAQHPNGPCQPPKIEPVVPEA